MKLLFSYFIHSLTDNLASKSTLRSEKSCPWARPAWQVKKEDRFHSVSSQVDSWDVFSSEFFRSQGLRELFDRFGLWSVNQLSLYYPWNSIAKIGLLKASHSAHTVSLHTSFHALHLLLPRKLIAQAWCHYIPEHREEGERENGQ